MSEDVKTVSPSASHSVSIAEELPSYQSPGASRSESRPTYESARGDSASGERKRPLSEGDSDEGSARDGPHSAAKDSPTASDSTIMQKLKKLKSQSGEKWVDIDFSKSLIFQKLNECKICNEQREKMTTGTWLRFKKKMAKTATKNKISRNCNFAHFVLNRNAFSPKIYTAVSDHDTFYQNVCLHLTSTPREANESLMTNIYFLLTISIHLQEKGYGNHKEIYGNRSWEYVFRYGAERVKGLVRRFFAKG